MRTSNHDRRSSRVGCCSVHCPQRTGLKASEAPPQSAERADATALNFVERYEVRTNSEKGLSWAQCCRVRCLQRTGLHGSTSNAKSAETADATARLLRASGAVDANDFARVRPIFGASDDSCSHRVLKDVIPFVSVALVAAQEMIVKTWLPERNNPLAGHAHAPGTGNGEGAIQVPFQAFDPDAQSDFASSTEADKEVHVVGHYEVTADTDAKLRRSATIIGKRVVYRGPRKNALSLMRVEGNEENRRVEALEDRIEARWLPFDHSPHRKCCSVRCPQRTSSRAGRCAAKSADDSARYSTSRRGRTSRRRFA